MTRKTTASRRALAFLLLTAAWTATVAAQGKPTRASLAHGKQLFYAHGCYGCHGYGGQTGVRDLVGTGSPILADEALFRLFLRLRGDEAPALPSTRMPNFPAEVLGDAAVHDLYAYIRTFKPSAPAPEQVPALRAILQSARAPYKP